MLSPPVFCHFSSALLWTIKGQGQTDHTLTRAAENNNADTPQDMDCPRRHTETRGQHLPRFPLNLRTPCPFHSLIKPLTHSLAPSPLSFPPLPFASFHPLVCACVCVCVGVICVWGALSACRLPGYQSNWGAPGELLLSEAEPSVPLNALILFCYSLHLSFLAHPSC